MRPRIKIIGVGFKVIVVEIRPKIGPNISLGIGNLRIVELSSEMIALLNIKSHGRLSQYKCINLLKMKNKNKMIKQNFVFFKHDD